jgi:pyruvate ferredoxin oxidoreductase beta subunit
MGLEVARLATETRFWPLYEVENGQYKMTYQNEKAVEFEKYLELQGRFKHLGVEKNKKVIETVKQNIKNDYQYLLKKCDCLG